MEQPYKNKALAYSEVNQLSPAKFLFGFECSRSTVRIEHEAIYK